MVFTPSVPPYVEVPELDDEFLYIGADAVCQSIPGGILSSALKPSFWKQFPPEKTARNTNTVQKILALL